MSTMIFDDAKIVERNGIGARQPSSATTSNAVLACVRASIADESFDPFKVDRLDTLLEVASTVVAGVGITLGSSEADLSKKKREEAGESQPDNRWLYG